ncbi:hypothetical protein [Ketobacter sp.]|uniref:hypothetical protein n=1 Tax=Ketobacter sp. TaxID=2083498 RepID=UPI000F24D447|nr:hypothetical protein [Ketobacter sp.]RLT92498.1 MAG: hypothetical protein D9N14_20360 [Ketobacter sp.]
MVKKKTTLALLPITLCFSSLPVLAATTADLEKRLEQQEKQIKRLENRLKGTRAAVKENRSRISDAADRLQINGFMTAGAAVNDGDDVYEPFYGIDDDTRSSAISKAGVQMTFEITEDWDATVQLLSRGANGYDLQAEWAYLGWQATDNLALKFGRQRLPYYLLSEYLDVGYALPWIIPPLELYNIPATTTDGISGVYSFNVGSVNFAAQAYAGQSTGRTEQLEADFISSPSWGANLTADWNSFTFRVGYNRSTLRTDPDEGGVADSLVPAMQEAESTYGPAYGVADPGNLEISTENIRTDYISAGFMYDDGSLLVMGEIANLSAETFQPVGDAGYITVGYRFGKWMPHLTFSKFQTDSKADDRIRAIQEYADAVGKAMYSSAGVVGVPNPGLVATNGYFNSDYAGLGVTNGIITSSLCPTLDAVATGCELSVLGQRDALHDAVIGYSQTIYNSMEDQIQEQQSVTIGLVYDINPRVKAKLQATHYENFGANTYQYLNYGTEVTGVGALETFNGFTTVDGHSNGRFSGDPDAAGNHTAIYSFSIDAVF